MALMGEVALDAALGAADFVVVVADHAVYDWDFIRSYA
jgi:hypothetical protein